MALKKAQKDMIKGGLVAMAVLIFKSDWYFMLKDRIQGGGQG